MQKLLESSIQKACINFLNLRGIFNYKINNGGVYIKAKDRYMVAQTKGIPDLIMHYKGFVHYVEFKTPTGRMSEHQLNFRARCEYDGINYLIIHSVDELVGALKCIDLEVA
jgi:hypothetical protein